MAWKPTLALAAVAMMAAGCGDDGGMTTADVQAAAKERVRDQLGLTPQSVLFTETFVGQPVNGDTVLCGTVAGKTADGRTVAPRRFIAASDPARWVKFEPASDSAIPSQPEKFVEWPGTCEPSADSLTSNMAGS